MRTIKFRMWTGFEMMLPLQEMHCTGNEGYTHLEQCLQNDAIMVNSLWDADDRDDGMIMQFTGLFDKNGKEIYEGDIVVEKSLFRCKCSKNNEFCIVKWDEMGGWHPFIDYDRECEELYDMSKCEVIGNIYETPELLTK